MGLRSLCSHDNLSIGLAAADTMSCALTISRARRNSRVSCIRREIKRLRVRKENPLDVGRHSAELWAGVMKLFWEPMLLPPFAVGCSRQPLLHGNCFAMVTTSSGSSITATGATTRIGLEPSTLRPRTLEALRAKPFPTANPLNPVDTNPARDCHHHVPCLRQACSINMMSAGFFFSETR